MCIVSQFAGCFGSRCCFLHFRWGRSFFVNYSVFPQTEGGLRMLIKGKCSQNGQGKSVGNWKWISVAVVDVFCLLIWIGIHYHIDTPNQCGATTMRLVAFLFKLYHASFWGGNHVSKYFSGLRIHTSRLKWRSSVWVMTHDASTVLLSHI